MENISFKQICNTAILRSGAMTNKSSFELLDNLACTLIENEKYDEFSKESFSKDFFDFYHLDIPPIVLGEVLNRLCTKKLLRKKDKNTFQTNKEEVNKINQLASLETFTNDRNLLVSFLLEYLHKNNYKTNKNDTESLLTKHIEESLSVLGNPQYRTTQLNSVEQYLLDSFVKEIKANNVEYYQIYKNILIGRLLATFIVTNTNVVDKNVTVLDKLILYLDTGVVFRLLGLDNYSTDSEYIDMINTLQGLGAKIKIFRHVYDEVYDIIAGSKYWISNYHLYSPVNASRVSEYFISNKYSVEQIDEFLLKLEDRFKDFNIEIEEANIDYNEPDALGVYEENIFKAIKEQYTLTGGYQENKEDTYRIDAKSIYSIHKLRKGKKYRKISDAGYILITTNRGIAKVARECASSGNNGIAYAITDAYLSLLLFFSYPNYSDETNMRFLIPTAYHAFRPSKDLLAKMESVLREMKDKGVMSESQVFSWISNVALGEEVLAITNNNPDLFDESVPEKIIEKIKNDASDDIKKNKEEAEKRIQKANRQSEEAFRLYVEADDKKKSLIKELNEKDKKQIEYLTLQKKNIETKATRKVVVFKWVFVSMLFLVIACAIGGITYLIDYFLVQDGYRYISYIISGVSMVVLSWLSFNSIVSFCTNCSSKIIKNRKHNKIIKELTNQIDEINTDITNRN